MLNNEIGTENEQVIGRRCGNDVPQCFYLRRKPSKLKRKSLFYPKLCQERQNLAVFCVLSLHLPTPRALFIPNRLRLAAFNFFMSTHKVFQTQELARGRNENFIPEREKKVHKMFSILICFCVNH